MFKFIIVIHSLHITVKIFVLHDFKSNLKILYITTIKPKLSTISSSKRKIHSAGGEGSSRDEFVEPPPRQRCCNEVDSATFRPGKQGLV